MPQQPEGFPNSTTVSESLDLFAMRMHACADRTLQQATALHGLDLQILEACRVILVVVYYGRLYATGLYDWVLRCMSGHLQNAPCCGML